MFTNCWRVVYFEGLAQLRRLFSEDTNWAVALFFIVFVTFTNLMVMNLIIGVIVEKIMTSTREQDKEATLKPTKKDFEVFGALQLTSRRSAAQRH